MDFFSGASASSISLWVYFLGLGAYYALFTAHRIQNLSNRYASVRVSAVETISLTLAFLGDTVLPIVFAAIGWPALATYPASPILLIAGAALWGASLWLFRRAHADLGRNWSPALVLRSDQTLVTTGVYSRIRHPVYAAKWMWGLAQALLVNNWVAGLAGLATFALTYFTRVPVEERMMLEAFGKEYQAYMERTGRILPKFRKPR
jgi:protein-S-isoprenylcysteine O-methyltransferase Ste14